MSSAPAASPSSISMFLRNKGWHRYNANDGKCGYRVSRWNEGSTEDTVVRIEVNGVRHGMGLGRFSESSIRERGREHCEKIRRLLLDAGYNVGWGWDVKTGEVDTTFLAVTKYPRVPVAAEGSDPHSKARQLMGWVENYLVQEKYLKSGSYPLSPSFGFEVTGSIDNWGPTHVKVDYRPGQFEEHSAIVDTVRAYEAVLKGHGLVTLVRLRDGKPSLYVTEDPASLLELVARMDEFEETDRRHAAEAEREEELEEEMAEERAAGSRLRGLLITLPQIEAAVREIEELVGQGNEDAARLLENQTYRSVLLAIVGGPETDPADMAAAALETQRLPFRR